MNWSSKTRQQLLLEIEDLRRGLDGGDFFPWALRKVLGGETIAITKMADLPPEATPVTFMAPARAERLSSVFNERGGS